MKQKKKSQRGGQNAPICISRVNPNQAQFLLNQLS